MKPTTRKTIEVALTAVLVLATCELATRVFSTGRNSIAQRDPEIGRRYPRNMSRVIYDDELEHSVTFKTNQIGFRGEPFAAKPQGVRRIAIVGDSYTASEALSQDDTFCAVLQNQLNQRSSGKWEVLNFGMVGSGTAQQLALYRAEIRRLDVDAIIVAFGNATDARDNSAELRGKLPIHFELDERGHLIQMPQAPSKAKLSNILNQYSRFYGWQKRQLSQLKDTLRSKTQVIDRQHQVFQCDEPPAFQRAWALTGEILRTLRDDCDRDGVTLLIAAMPSAHQVYPDLFTSLSEQHIGTKLDASWPDKKLRDICDLHSIPLNSLTEDFKKHTPSASYLVNEEQLFIKGMGHLNSRGSQVVATALRQWILSDSVRQAINASKNSTMLR